MKNLLAIWMLLAAVPMTGQIQLDTLKSPQHLVEQVLLGDGVVVGNVRYKGARGTISRFTDEEEIFGIGEGIFLSTGHVKSGQGPNNSFHAGWARNYPGDHDLDQLAGGKTMDAAILEFDFITQSENLEFQFVFGSEEYLEYVGSKFNDVFGFFISGPDKDKENLAVIPETMIPVSVNTINHRDNRNYFRDNTFENTTDRYIWDIQDRKVVKNPKYHKDLPPPPYNVQYDGFTTVLIAKTTVIPNRIYHIKIAIADVADGILDSGVFLKGGTFRSYGDQVVSIDNRFKKRPVVAMRGIVRDDPPRERTPTGVTVANKIINVEFDFDSYQFSNESERIIEDVYRILEQYPSTYVELKGHTDSIGSNEYNLRLSEKRAHAVESYLIELGLDKDRIHTGYWGETLPIWPNTNPLGRSKNRRVEFVVREPSSVE